jgi:hypothetical protein
MIQAYLAGPMRGYPELNFPAFHEAARFLRLCGIVVWSPAEIDLPEGFDPTKDDALPLKHYMKTDLPAVCDADCVVVLKGWEKSQGAKLETLVAARCDIPVYEYEEVQRAYRDGDQIPRPIPPKDIEAITSSQSSGDIAQAEPEELEEDMFVVPTRTLAEEAKRKAALEMLRRPPTETRVTSSTGGQKGTKPERYSLLPWAQLDEVARLYAFGATKYDDHNWMGGYAWHLSYDALVRHLRAFWLGEAIDEETGCHHLASVVFHALALMYFEQHHPDFDDRPQRPPANQ